MSYFGLIIIAFFLIIILLVLSTVTGEFPEPLPLSENRNKEMIEVLLLWTLNLVVVILFIFFIGPYFYSIFFNDIFPGIIFSSLTSLIIPLIYVITINKWKIKDFGLTNKVESWPTALIGIISYMFLGILTFFLYIQNRYSIIYLLILLYSNAFLEEFLYRSILQSKLERAIGQKNSIIYGGLLFGFIHLPTNIATFLVYPDIIWIMLVTSTQILHGWIYGIIYTKTRNLFPGIICHYFTNWLAEIITLFL